MRNRNENPRGDVAANRNPSAPQRERDAEKIREKDRSGAQQPGEGRGDVGQQRQKDPNQGPREGGDSKGRQSNWSPGRSTSEGEGVKPRPENEDHDPARVDRGREQKL
ncbi:MAG: hypothetical protein AMXMBFR36_33810 [Acidobacteriota bacterium]